MKTRIIHCAVLAASVLALCAPCLEAQTYDFGALSLGPFQAYAPPPGPVPVSINHQAITVNSPFLFSSLVATQLVDFSPTMLIPPQPPSVLFGELKFTTPSGDKLLGTYSGVLLGTANPAVYTVPGVFTFMGGTGPFAGATGGGQLDALILFSDATMSGGTSSINWDGSITMIPEPQVLSLWALSGLLVLAIRRCR